jgi:positive regulator of sigma E activity
MEGGLIHYKIVGTLGSTGLGLVWGWLIGSLKRRVYRLRKTIPLVLLATMVISAQVLWFLDWVRLLFFFGAALFAFFIHVEWRRKLIHIRNA